MRPTTPIRTALLLAVACGGVLAACSDDPRSEPPPEDRGELTVYSSLPLQGDAKPQSEDIVRAIEMALADRDGQAGGYDINYVSLDDANPQLESWHPDQVAENAERAADDPNTIAYLGDFNSGASVVSIPILNQAGILQVSPSNTYAGLTRADGAEPGEPHIYYPTGERSYGRVVPADHVQAGALVAVMRDRGCTNVFVAHHEEIYGVGLADAVERAAGDAGLEVIGKVALGPEAPAALEAASPDCFFFAGLTMDGATDVANDVAASQPGIQMFFPDGCAETAFTEGLDESAAESTYLTNPTLSRDDYPPAGESFYAEFEQAEGRPPEPYAIYGYEAMSVVLDAIDRAGEAAAATPDGRAAVVAAFFDTSDRESVLGTYDIDDYGDTTLSAYGGYVVEGGEVAYDGVITPVVPEPVSGPEITPVPQAALSPLEGTWVGGKVTPAMMRSERSAKETRAVFEANGAKDYLVTTLEVRDDSWQLLLSADGGPDQGAQGGTFSVDGDLIQMNDGFANYTYRYQLSGDELIIELVESDAGMAAPGVSDDAFQYAHYATPFIRAD